MKRYAVQIILPRDEYGECSVDECFLRILYFTGYTSEESKTDEKIILRLEAPDRVDTKVWATKVAKCSRDLGFKAEVVVSDRIN